MKNKPTLFVLARTLMFSLALLTGFSLFAQTLKSGNSTITSTTSGGNWSETSTWVGGVVPTASDDVVIDGTVTVDKDTFKCNNIKINSECTLINSNGNAENFIVAGSFINEGIVTKDVSGYLSISIGGNVINNGKWDSGDIIFTGTDDNEITMGATDVISNCFIQKDDNISYIVIGSNARFNNCHFTNLYSGELNLKIKEGENITLDLLKTSSMSGVIFDGGGSILANSYLYGESYSPTIIKNTYLTGVTKISSDTVIFRGDNVVLTDTLTTDKADRDLLIEGNFINNGEILLQPFKSFKIFIKGNVVNNGYWDYTKTIIDGSINQDFANKGTLFSSFQINSNVDGASTYQWYKNDQILSGSTDSLYLTDGEDVYGEYYCKTDAGDSRKITIVKGGSGGILLKEHFDSETFPPAGWTQSIKVSDKTWEKGNPQSNSFTDIDPTNVYSALCPYVDQDQDEWLKSPSVTLPSGTISIEFYVGHSTDWLTNATLKLRISTDGGINWTKIWEAVNDGNSWGWRKVTVDLSDYAGQTVMLAWQYVGNDGDLVGIDNVEINTGTTGLGKYHLEDDQITMLNYPNPFTSQTHITFNLENRSNVSLTIYNNLGQKIAQPFAGFMKAGHHQYIFEAAGLNSGVYYYRLVVNGRSTTKRMILHK